MLHTHDSYTYTENIKKAMCMAYDAHHGQTDLGGVPYIFHVTHLVYNVQETANLDDNVDMEDLVCVALLHDAVEDGHLTIDEIKAADFDDDVIEAITLLTRDKSKPYEDYIMGLRDNELAAAVKLADLFHNKEATRLKHPSELTESEKARMAKYENAINLLLELDDEQSEN